MAEIKEIVVTEPHDHPNVFSEPTVTVRFTDYLDSTAIDILTEHNDAYVLVGIFFNNEAAHIYFSDAKRHNELNEAIRSYGIEVDDFYYALAYGYLDDQKQIVGLHFNLMPGVTRNDAEKNILHLMDHIDPQSLKNDQLIISWRTYPIQKQATDITYIYNIQNKTLTIENELQL